MTPVIDRQQPTPAATVARQGQHALPALEPGPHAVIVGGDAPTRAMLRFLLEGDGCLVQEAAAPDAVRLAAPDTRVAVLAVIVEPRDRPLAAVLHALRQHGYVAPLLVAARQPTLHVRQTAFRLGARDVISLPVGAQELQARLRAIIGAPASTPRPCRSATPVAAGGLVLHPATRTIRGGTTGVVRVTQQEAAILARLMQAPGQVVGRHELLDHVWGESYAGAGGALDVCVHRLRRKLAQPGVPHGYIRTRPGQGYCFEARRVPRPAASPSAGPAATGASLRSVTVPAPACAPREPGPSSATC